jgi:CBS domain-containing protein
MEPVVRISEILAAKGSEVIKGSPDLTLVEAARVMVEKGVGALVLVDREGRIVGIASERDVLRFAARSPDILPDTRVGDVMTREVLVGLPDDTVEWAMGLMTSRRIRHLPIMSEGLIVGIVSIGDLVKTMAREAEFQVRLLRDYISGNYPG